MHPVTLEAVNQHNQEAHGGKYPCIAIEQEVTISRTGRRHPRRNYRRICTTHGEFVQRHGHGHKHGCPKCQQEAQRLTLEDLAIAAKPVHGEKYIYYKTQIRTDSAGRSRTYVEIICPNHGIFVQRAQHHLSGNGCPTCGCTSVSKLETTWLDELKIGALQRQHEVKANGRRYILDGYDPNTNTAYEFLGDFYHGNPAYYSPGKLNTKVNRTFGKLYEYTLQKEADLKLAGYNVISIWESEYLTQKRGSLPRNFKRMVTKRAMQHSL